MASDGAHDHRGISRATQLGRYVVPALTTASHSSALLFSSFLVVHLGAPVAAVLQVGANAFPTASSSSSSSSSLTAGATDAASRWMLLGRVYYQSALTEPVVVWGSLAVHVASSIAKRGVNLWIAHDNRKRNRERRATKYKQRQDSLVDRRHGEKIDVRVDQINSDTLSSKTESDAIRQCRRTQATSMLEWLRSRIALPIPSTLHALTGYVLIPSLLSHVLLTRLVPVSSDPPISELSPSELDYSIISYGLAPPETIPSAGASSSASSKAVSIVSWAVLGSLVLTASWHTASGVHLITQRLRARAQARGTKRARDARQGDIQQTSPSPAHDKSSSGQVADPLEILKHQRRKQLLRTMSPSVLGSAVVLVGATAIAHDHPLMSSWTRKRFDAVYSGSWPWSLF